MTLVAIQGHVSWQVEHNVICILDLAVSLTVSSETMGPHVEQKMVNVTLQSTVLEIRVSVQLMTTSKMVPLAKATALTVGQGHVRLTMISANSTLVKVCSLLAHQLMYPYKQYLL